MNQLERNTDFLSVILSAMQGTQSKLWTATPGIIQSFNDVAMTCVVQPSIREPLRMQDGRRVMHTLPLLLDCPVMFPGGGGCTLTFPVKPGDECLVVLSSRCIDSWWQSGGVQDPAEFRMHDLSDGFAFVGVRSQPRAFPVSSSATQLRSDDGVAFVEIHPGSHAVNVTTAGDITMTAPNIVLNGNVQINGPVAQSGGGSTMQGPLAVAGDVTAGGKSLLHHIHGGVLPGGGNTGQPV